MEKQIVLASKSPRRQKLLKEIFPSFAVDASLKPEKKPFYVSLRNTSKYLAKQKAKDVFKRHLNDIVIGADTIVYVNHQVLGKPKDIDDILAKLPDVLSADEYVNEILKRLGK